MQQHYATKMQNDQQEERLQANDNHGYHPHSQQQEIDELRRRLTELESHKKKRGVRDETESPQQHPPPPPHPQPRRRSLRRRGSNSTPRDLLLFAHLSSSSRRLGERNRFLETSSRSLDTTLSGGSVVGLYGDSSSSEEDELDHEDVVVDELDNVMDGKGGGSSNPRQQQRTTTKRASSSQQQQLQQPKLQQHSERHRSRRSRRRPVEFSKDVLRSFRNSSKKYSSISLMLNDQGIEVDDDDDNGNGINDDDDDDDDDDDTRQQYYCSTDGKTSDSDYAKKGSDDDMNSVLMDEATLLDHSNRSDARQREQQQRREREEEMNHRGPSKQRQQERPPSTLDDGTDSMQPHTGEDDDDDENDPQKTPERSVETSSFGRKSPISTKFYQLGGIPEKETRLMTEQDQPTQYQQQPPPAPPPQQQQQQRQGRPRQQQQKQDQQRRRRDVYDDDDDKYNKKGNKTNAEYSPDTVLPTMPNNNFYHNQPRTTSMQPEVGDLYEDDDPRLSLSSSSTGVISLARANKPASFFAKQQQQQQQRRSPLPPPPLNRVLPSGQQRTVSMQPQVDEGSTRGKETVLSRTNVEKMNRTTTTNNNNNGNDDNAAAPVYGSSNQQDPGLSTPPNAEESEEEMIPYSPVLKQRFSETENSVAWEEVYLPPESPASTRGIMTKKSTTTTTASYNQVKAVDIDKSGTISVTTPALAANDMEEARRPCFRNFALLSIQPQQMMLLNNDYLFADSGGNLDCFSINEMELADRFPRGQDVPLTELGSFCFPNGLHVRMIPKAGIEGALRMGMVGPKGDRCHVMVFTNEQGQTDHGVAITVRWAMNFKRLERQKISQIVRDRRKRRLAQTKIARWWKRCQQDEVLTEALQISGYGNRSAEDLRAGLSRGELQLLEKSLRHNSNKQLLAPPTSTPSSRSNNNTQSRQPNNPIQKQLKKRGIHAKVRNILTRGSRKSATVNQENASEVEAVTRRAMMRSPQTENNSSNKDGAATATEDTTERSPPAETTDSERKRTRNPFRLGGQRILLRGANKAASQPPNQQGSSVTTPSQPPKQKISKWARKRGLEAFEAMKESDRMGYICVVERCYVLIGCRPDEHVLLLGPLQQLINAERGEMLEQRQRAKTALRKKRVTDVDDVELERRLVRQQKERRHIIIRSMLEIDHKQAPQPTMSQWEALADGPERRFRVHINVIPKAEPLDYPLPLPSIGKQWALAKLLIDVGPDPLVLALKLLLLERSVLVLGEHLQEVTTCACALVELLRPFEWASAFTPILPPRMLDIVTSPVPFVAGMAALDVSEIENDDRTLEAMATGMSLLNLSTNTLHITSEKGISQVLSLCPYLREQLGYLRGRLIELGGEPGSALLDFQAFIRHGLSRKESLTLNSVALALEGHFAQLGGDLAYNSLAWKRYGTVDVKTNKFIFHPEWFLNPMRADLAFQEKVVHTQLFHGYVDVRRREQQEVEKLRRGPPGQFIANWIYKHWAMKKA